MRAIERAPALVNYPGLLDHIAAAVAAGRQRGMRMSDLLQFFSYDHLSLELRAVSRQFSELAHHMDASLPHNPESEMALRKLLEAKDCAVRAILYTFPVDTE